MLITDLLEDIHRCSGDEIEFHLIDKEGNAQKLELCISTLGKYLYTKKDKEGNNTDILILGLMEPDAQTK